MSSVSGGGGGSSGCDVWGSATETGDFPSGAWAIDPEDKGQPPLPSELATLPTNINVKEVVTSVKTDVKSLSSADKDKSPPTIGSITEKVDSLRKLLVLQDDLAVKPEGVEEICDSALISCLLGCSEGPALAGKGAQLLYHLLKREDQLGGCPTFSGLKDEKMMKELVTMVDGGKEEVAKFWGLCALEFILRGGVAARRKSFLEELDGVALLMRVKDGFSHSVDLQNATDRILITLEELEEEAKQQSSAESVPAQPVKKENTGQAGNDFPTVGVWQPPAPPTPVSPATTTASTTSSRTSQPLPSTATSPAPTVTGVVTTPTKVNP